MNLIQQIGEYRDYQDSAISESLNLDSHAIVADGKLVDSGSYTGMEVGEARERIMEDAKRLKIGGYLNSSKVRSIMIYMARVTLSRECSLV
jgi:valyl-tRNA synthetase